MSDDSVRAALRSEVRFVLVEAPAGCGKTYQGADYVREIAGSNGVHRPLILTHTHAACSVFSERTRGMQARVDIRTIDSVIGHIATAYHAGLGLPGDIPAWVRQRDDGYAELANRVAALLKRHPMIAASLAQRHQVVVCDEHQDSSSDQHALAMALLEQGARLRVFADPMQKIFQVVAGASPACEWDELKKAANAFEELDVPHRWKNGCQALGDWTLAARKALMGGGRIDLRGGLPRGVEVVFAENEAQRNLDYRISNQDRRPIDRFEQRQKSLLILTRHNDTAKAFRALFNRRIPLWEGHTRSGLEKLVNAMIAGQGDPCALATAVVAFINEIGKGFSPSGFADRFEQEVRERCTRNCRGKPAAIQELARCILADASHRGVARMLRHLSELRAAHPAFADVEMDCYREFWDAIRLGDFEAIDAEITHRRTYSRPKPPERAISTIHKAKGLECDSVILTV